MFAKNKHTTEINGNSGSIPFSGKSIPPDKLCSQYSSNIINKAFMPMLMIFSNNCLFLFLKLKIFKNVLPVKIPTIKVKKEKSTSCDVHKRSIVAIPATSIKIL